MSLVKRVAYMILMTEGVTNMAIFGPLMYVFPEEFGIRPFIPEGVQVDGISRTFARMLGGMISTLGGYCLVQALRKGGDVEDIILSAFLVGDFLYVGSFANWAYHMNFWPATSEFNVLYGLLLPLCRIIYVKEKWMRSCNKHE
uniref:Uncharacterized protein n=1 Tax=Aplanochytrium stocchinoi TaxID=215587 RepID=A0A7S3V394_9STRA